MMKLWAVNTMSFLSMASIAANLEKGLTIALLVTAIALNIKKFRDKDDR